jgi:hypothetical protein
VARMLRTQIYLEPELSMALARLARQRGTSKAELIRLAAHRFLEAEGAEGEDPLLGLIGIGKAKPGRVSEEHDRVLTEEARGARSA